MKSRWADDEDDAAADAARKREKEEKKRAKAEKQRKADALLLQQQQVSTAVTDAQAEQNQTELSNRPSKRRKLSPEREEEGKDAVGGEVKLLRFPVGHWKKCRSVEEYEKLNDIEEGAYGWVSRARDSATGQVVALKRLKMDNANDGIPVTGLREIQTLTDCEHPNIVALREVVVGEDTKKIEKYVILSIYFPFYLKEWLLMVFSIFLVLDFLEHDLKTLLEEMPEPFLTSEIKTLLLQLVSGVLYLHNTWILHRDLKTSNLLLNNRGVLKIADFGMARYFGDPPPKMTQLVVTLWYRAPELLLGTERYGTAVDMWSVGCIFGELLTKEPLLQGKNEVDELSKIFELCGIPTEDSWPGFRRLPNARSLRLPKNPVSQGSVLRAKFPFLTSSGSELLISLLSLNPAKRPSAKEVLDHGFFKEDPKPKSREMFPTFPSKAGQEKRRRRGTPNAPVRGKVGDIGAVDFSGIFAGREEEERGGGFSLKLI